MVESSSGNLTNRGSRSSSSAASAAASAATSPRNNSNNNDDNGRLSNTSNSSPAAKGTAYQRYFNVVLMFVIRILLSPILKLIRLIFPPGDFDGLSGPVTAKAANNFVECLKEIQKANQLTSSSSRSNDDNNDGGGSSDNLDHWSTSGFEEIITSQLASSSTSTGGAGLTRSDSTASSSSNSNYFPSKLVLVYLHSPYHRESEAFCRDVLLSPEFQPFLKHSHIVCLGVSVHTAQGAYLAQMVNATSYPCMCLLQPKRIRSSSSSSSTSSSRSTSSSQLPSFQLVFKAEGTSLMAVSSKSSSSATTAQRGSSDANAASCVLLDWLNITLTKFEVMVAEQEAKRLAREQEVELRRQQDAEYQEALLMDQQREREKEQKRKEEEELQRLEEEKANAEKERYENIKNKIRPEPDATAERGTTTRIRFQLPTGAKIDRRFYNDETIESLKAFLIVHFHEKLNMEDVNNIGLSTNFPKKSYNDDDDLTKDMQQAGLAPQAMLMVQDLDA